MNSRKIKLFTTTAIAAILLAACSANSTASSANTDSNVLASRIKEFSHPVGL